MAKQEIYRLSFDFRTFEDMAGFYDSLGFGHPGEPDAAVLVEVDSLHDIGKEFHDYIVREANPGNGRAVFYDPVTFKRMEGNGVAA